MTQDDKAPVPGWVEKAAEEFSKGYGPACSGKWDQRGIETLAKCCFEFGAALVLERAMALVKAAENLRGAQRNYMKVRTDPDKEMRDRFGKRVEAAATSLDEVLTQWRKEMGVE